MMRTRQLTAALSAAVLISLVGCSGSDGQSSGDAPTTSNADATETTEADTDGSGDGESASGAAVEQSDPDDLIVSQEIQMPGSPGDTATIGVVSLAVDGKVQILRLMVTPHFESASDSETVNLYDVLGKSAFRPTLVDTENLKEYSVLSDTGAWWTSDTVYSKTTNGEPMVVFAVFAAPEDDVDSFDILVHDAWPAFTDVPVTQ